MEKFGKNGLNRFVCEGRDLLVLMEKYTPSLLFYLNRARNLARYIKWNNCIFVDNLAHLEKKGFAPDPRAPAIFYELDAYNLKSNLEVSLWLRA